MENKKNIRSFNWLPAFVLSPTLLLLYIFENTQQYSSQERDLIIQFSGAFISIIILLVYRSYMQYILSFIFMTIVTITVGHIVILGIPLSKILTNFDGIFAMSTILEILGAHLLSMICFSLLVKNGVLGRIRRDKNH